MHRRCSNCTAEVGGASLRHLYRPMWASFDALALAWGGHSGLRHQHRTGGGYNCGNRIGNPGGLVGAPAPPRTTPKCHLVSRSARAMSNRWHLHVVQVERPGPPSNRAGPSGEGEQTATTPGGTPAGKGPRMRAHADSPRSCEDRSPRAGRWTMARRQHRAPQGPTATGRERLAARPTRQTLIIARPTGIPVSAPSFIGGVAARLENWPQTSVHRRKAVAPSRTTMYLSSRPAASAMGQQTATHRLAAAPSGLRRGARNK